MHGACLFNVNLFYIICIDVYYYEFQNLIIIVH